MCIRDRPWTERENLKKKLQEDFLEFERENAPGIMKEEIAKVVKRGLSLGLSRDDLIRLVDEVSVEEVMES